MSPTRHLPPLTTLVVAFALAGCGAGSGSQVLRSHLRVGRSVVPDSQAARVVEAVALHASLPFSGGAAPGAAPESREFVAVDGVFDPITMALSNLRPPAGTRLLAVRLTIEDIGGSTYRDDPGHEVSLVSESTGGYVGKPVAYTGRPRGCPRSLLKPIKLSAGHSVTGCVVFQVPVSQHITAVQYQTEGGAGGNRATWAVNRFDVHG